MENPQVDEIKYLARRIRYFTQFLVQIGEMRSYAEKELADLNVKLADALIAYNAACISEKKEGG